MKVTAWNPPAARPPTLAPGQEHRPLRKRMGETREQATERASKATWWPRRVRDEPVLCGAWWLWTVRP